MARRLAGFWAILVLAAPLAAAERRFDFRQVTLDNGLRVITLEDFSAPVVAVQVWYHVGSKDERPDRQGFAHMFEHMMFRGTDRLGPEAHFDLIRRTGGNCNAYTAFDHTTYINLLPAGRLPLVLWLEAERMAFLKIDRSNFDTERKVVEEERRLGLNQPYGTVPDQVLPVLFPGHPYRWSPIGRIPDLRAARVAELQRFWDTYYVPNNATLIIVGAVHHDEAQRQARQFFGWIPRSVDPPRIHPAGPRRAARRTITVQDPRGPVPLVGVVCRTAPHRDPDQAPLDVLATVLGTGESSRLSRDLVKTQKIAVMAQAMNFALEQDGLIGGGAALTPLGNPDRAVAALESELDRLIAQPISAHELTKARNELLKRAVLAGRTAAGKAKLLGESAVVDGDAERINRRIDQLRAVTAADVQRVARKYLGASHRTVVIVKPSIGGLLQTLLGGPGPVEDEGAGAAVAADDPAPPPRSSAKAGLRRPAGYPAAPPQEDRGMAGPAPATGLATALLKVRPVESRLDNGLKVVVVSNHTLPYVTATLDLLPGAWTDPAGRPGTANLAAAMISHGTRDHTAGQLAEALETHAIGFSPAVTLDSTGLSVGCLPEAIDRGVRLLAEMVRRPTFPADELATVRLQTLTGLMVETRQAAYQADREFRRRVFGAHPYARTATGEPGDLARISRDDLVRWWTTHVRPDQAVLYFAGDIAADRAVALARAAFGDWAAARSKPEHAVPATPEPEAATRIYLVDRPGSVQSQIVAGQRAIDRGSPDYPLAEVVTQVFGGSFGSRLNKALRVEKGLTYGAHGGFEGRRFSGTFRVSTFSKTPSTADAVRGILAQVTRIIAEPPTDGEIQMARSYLTGSFVVARETPQAIVNDLWLIESLGLPRDYFARDLAAVGRATPAEAARVSRRWIRPDRLTIVVVGEAGRIKDELARIAPVTLVKGSKK